MTVCFRCGQLCSEVTPRLCHASFHASCYLDHVAHQGALCPDPACTRVPSAGRAPVVVHPVLSRLQCIIEHTRQSNRRQEVSFDKTKGDTASIVEQTILATEALETQRHHEAAELEHIERQLLADHRGQEDHGANRDKHSVMAAAKDLTDVALGHCTRRERDAADRVGRRVRHQKAQEQRLDELHRSNASTSAQIRALVHQRTGLVAGLAQSSRRTTSLAQDLLVWQTIVPRRRQPGATGAVGHRTCFTCGMAGHLWIEGRGSLCATCSEEYLVPDQRRRPHAHRVACGLDGDDEIRTELAHYFSAWTPADRRFLSDRA